MADPDPKDIPDLDLPPPRSSTPKLSALPATRSGAPNPVTPPGSFGGDFGMSLERGPAVSAPPGATSRAPGRQVAIEIGGGDDFDMELERGGALVSLPPSTSGRPIGTASARPQVSNRPGSGLEVTYQRPDARRPLATGPSFVQKLVAWVVPLVLCAGTALALLKLVHRPAGRSITSLMPHAFDATSTVQSGALALVALALAIGLGFAGVKMIPRSYATIGAAGALLIASLAMVTVTLVSTEEHPTPADGALLIPYVVPLGLLLLGAGIAGRGPWLFLEGGARRAATFVVALAGGALIFAAIELSAIARLL